MGYHSKIPVVVPAVVAVADAALSINVFDGPQKTDDPSDACWIGYDGDPDSSAEAFVTSDQAWAGLGAKARNETIQITNAITFVDGGADPAEARARGYGYLAQFEDALHQNPSMGLTPPCRAGVTASALVPVNTEVGLEIVLRFTITVQTRL